MKKFTITLIILILVPLAGFSNTDMRDWKLLSGEKLRAELITYNSKEDKAILRMTGGTTNIYSQKDFTPIDAAWLMEWEEVTKRLEKMLKDCKGEFSHYQHAGTKITADFYVYTPSKYKVDQNLPMMILFHPGGKGARYVQRFLRAAEETDIIIVCSDAFRNTKDEGELADKLDEYFTEFVPALEETVKHDPKNLYMGGTSGGAMRAYNCSYEFKRPWAGIFANGGWLGGHKYRNKPYPALRVAMVNGHNDKPANNWIEHDSKVLTDRGGKVALFAFEGGHQVPPTKVQIQALKWLVYKEETKLDTDEEEKEKTPTD